MNNTRLKSALNGRSHNPVNSGNPLESNRRTGELRSPTVSGQNYKNRIMTNEDGYPVGSITQ